MVNNHNAQESYSNENDNSTESTNQTTLNFHPPFDFDKEFAIHRLAISQGNVEKAIQSFVLLQSNSGNSDKYNDYIIGLANHIDPVKDSDSSRFFQSLPSLIQSTIVDTASAHLEKTSYLKAYRILFDYIQAYPRHAYKYLIRTMKLLILGAQGRDKDHCIHTLVTNLFPRLWKQRVLLTSSGSAPSIKSTDGKHYLIIPSNLFEEFLRLGQRYYIDHRQWNDNIKFTCSMLDCCGYEGLARLDFLSHTNRFQYLKEQRQSLPVCQKEQPPSGQQTSTFRDDLTSGRAGGSNSTPTTSNNTNDNTHISDHCNNNKATTTSSTKLTSPLISTSATSVLGTNADKDTLSTLVAFTCEYMAVSSQFTQFAFEYYRAICVLDGTESGGTDSASDGGTSQRQEKACLIPICAIQSSNNLIGDHWKKSTTTTTAAGHFQQGGTRQKKKNKLDDTRGGGLDSYCMEGVDQTLQILSKAADCLRHLVNLWDWVVHTSPDIDWTTLFGGWETEFTRVIDAYQLPFDIYNAILLVRSDLALSTPSIPGNLSKALKLSQSICDRIEVQRRQGKEKAHLVEYNIPFMFAFRVLYTIGVIYLLVGSLQQSTLEIAIILSVFPIPQELNDKDFITDELDCHTAGTVFRDHEYGLMHVTQRGLVVRCIKHLIVSLDNETGQQGGMASLDSAMRWDEKAGNMMVLMQYGWPYWNTRTDFWDKVIHQMKERRTFRNRSVLEYIFVPEMLQILKNLHESKQVAMDILSSEFIMRNGQYQAQQQQHQHEQHRSASSSTTSPTIPSRRLTHVNTTSTDSTTAPVISADDDRTLPSLSSLPLSSKSMVRPPPTSYEPSVTNTILPSMDMSPSWYSVSTQNTSQVNWMSPSFYYSRPATSVVIPKKKKKRTADQISGSGDEDDDDDQDDQDGGNHDNTAESQQTSEHQRGDDDEDGLSGTTNVVPKRNFMLNEMISRYLDQRIQRFTNHKISPQRLRHVLQHFLKNMVVKGSEED
ncbi:hypothetical protein BC941DRAFT_495762 [Chlamydoabsidia padenii]|nr:hypothetical protein BC941DRAFT_495762 [Chlamydoabsidia padenii]